MKEFIDKLIERLEEKAYNHFDLKLSDAIEIVTELAEEYKVSEMPTGWISVSERLPKADHYVLCQGNNSMFVACVDSFDGEWRDNHFYKRTNVKAWCELPAPYTEVE